MPLGWFSKLKYTPFQEGVCVYMFPPQQISKELADFHETP